MEFMEALKRRSEIKMNLREVEVKITTLIKKRSEASERLARLKEIADPYDPKNIMEINGLKQAVETLSSDIQRLEVERGNLLDAEEAARKEYTAALAVYDGLIARLPNGEKEAAEIVKRHAKTTEAAERARSILIEKINTLDAITGGMTYIPGSTGNAWKEFAREYEYEIVRRT